MRASTNIPPMPIEKIHTRSQTNRSGVLTHCQADQAAQEKLREHFQAPLHSLDGDRDTKSVLPKKVVRSLNSMCPEENAQQEMMK